MQKLYYYYFLTSGLSIIIEKEDYQYMNERKRLFVEDTKILSVNAYKTTSTALISR